MLPKRRAGGKRRARGEREASKRRARGEQESDSEKKELKIDAVKKMLCVFSLIAQKDQAVEAAGLQLPICYRKRYTGTGHQHRPLRS